MRPLIALPLLASHALAQEGPTWAEVGPLLAERCVMCHVGDGAPFGLRLDSLAGALAGSWTGPVLVAGDTAGSELLRRVRGESRPAMPLVGEPLGLEEIALLEAWVAAGMPEGAPEDAPVDGADEAEVAQETAPGPSEPVTFAHVERILLQRCVRCHSDANPEGAAEDLHLDTLSGVLAGGERLVVVPGNVAASEIVRRIEGRAQPRMPLDGPPWLSGEDIDLIRRWIEGGARDADGAPSPVPVGAEVRFRGVMTGETEIDGIPFRIGGGTRIDDRPGVGQEGEVRGVVAPDGGIEATRLRDR